VSDAHVAGGSRLSAMAALCRVGGEANNRGGVSDAHVAGGSRLSAMAVLCRVGAGVGVGVGGREVGEGVP
jgi:hypothetical protein